MHNHGFDYSSACLKKKIKFYRWYDGENRRTTYYHRNYTERKYSVNSNIHIPGEITVGIKMVVESEIPFKTEIPVNKTASFW